MEFVCLFVYKEIDTICCRAHTGHTGHTGHTEAHADTRIAKLSSVPDRGHSRKAVPSVLQGRTKINPFDLYVSVLVRKVFPKLFLAQKFCVSLLHIHNSKLSGVLSACLSVYLHFRPTPFVPKVALWDKHSKVFFHGSYWTLLTSVRRPLSHCWLMPPIRTEAVYSCQK
jgi:hypothetical protein